MLSGLVASDYGALGAGVSDTIDSNLDTIANRDKWTVEISKPSSDITDPGGGYDEEEFIHLPRMIMDMLLP